MPEGNWGKQTEWWNTSALSLASDSQTAVSSTLAPAKVEWTSCSNVQQKPSFVLHFQYSLQEFTVKTFFYFILIEEHTKYTQINLNDFEIFTVLL